MLSLDFQPSPTREGGSVEAFVAFVIDNRAINNIINGFSPVLLELHYHTFKVVLRVVSDG